ncbi:imm11 family protein [Myxococcus sp. RHSTA-1-4]|uniref:imm11 family protein n=1 Tax=Myxococcus sp. RHSTA-1-4 TaxID=2874601 RepID=UPI001CBF3880
MEAPARRKSAARRASPRPGRPVRYFDLHDDFRAPGRRELGDPVSLDRRKKVDSVWLFTSGAAVHGLGKLRAAVQPPGRPLDFSLAGAGLTPIVHARVASIFRELAPDDVQLLPVEVEDCDERYFILVATRLVRCIDERACAEAHRYTEADGLPERVGHYRTVRGLRIDPEKTDGARVFRSWGWPVSLIVSEGIKEALEHAGITGARFAEVTGPTPGKHRRKSGTKKPRKMRR